MMIVIIRINARMIKKICAVNETGNETGQCVYRCWDGLKGGDCKRIFHIREDGAEILAKKMLEAFP